MTVSKKYSILEIYTCIVLFILLFFSSAPASDAYSDILIPHININQNHALFFTTLAFIIYSIFKQKKVNINKYMILLGGFVIYQLMSLIIFNKIDIIKGYYGNYFSIINAFFVFYLFSTFKINKQQLKNILIIFLIAFTLQLLFLLIVMPVSYNDSLFKFYLHLPIGASNYLGCLIVPIIIYIFITTKNFLYKYLYIFWGLALTIILKNRAGVMVLALFAIIITLTTPSLRKKIIGLIINFKALICKKRLYLWIFGIVSLVAIWIIVPYISRFFLGYFNSITDPNFSFLDKLTSNRSSVYSYIFDMSMLKPIFGFSAQYYTLSYSAHNFILELLCRDGMVGLCLYLTLLILLLKSSYKHNMFFIIICVLFQGLFEVSMFRFSIDIILWAFLGIMQHDQNSKLSKMI